MNPLVSILIPVYNREKIVGDTIQSAINQTYTNIEIIIVDNCSTDGTWAVLEDYQKKDSRILIFRNEKNVGPVRNWGISFEKASGEFGKIIYSDDTIESTFLEQSVPFLKNKEIAFVFTSVKLGKSLNSFKISYETYNDTQIYSSQSFIKNALYRENAPVSPGCALFRLKDLKKNLQFEIPSPSLKDFYLHGAGNDLLLFLITAHEYPSVAFIKRPLVFFRDHKNSISIQTNRRYLFDCYIQAKVFFVENYLTKDDSCKLYLHIWYQYVREYKRKVMPKILLKKYTNQFDGFTLKSVIEFLRFKITFKSLIIFLKIRLKIKF
jgi:glycosyltransferase involved in cell wall biosynthesis